ncbi:hypothetical protein [Amedibacillus dolichus]|uniref:hypothetical protein n=1 Tax=Amedibacillus dolichus TaxID=31971 RepID=UPI00241D1AC2|nr:hypothetical protein [Amedibacillus dolichus]
MSRFNIPVVLFIFKRKDTVLKIIERIKNVEPSKIYIIGDEGRDDNEKLLAHECREAVEDAIDWNCEIIKNYAESNRGVHAQIGMGALWVFEKEETAIFLEDDNLPEVSFFEYCRQCLEKYKNEEQIFWICGTNYLEKCEPKNNSSVFASKHLMPCGWASWAWKFKKYYDYDLKLTEVNNWENKLRTKYKSFQLYKQQLRSIKGELRRKNENLRYNSWDYHTVLSIRMNDLYGIVPKCNQIKNIGVDEFSTHGGNSFDLIMTQRFCGIESYNLPNDLILPDVKNLDFSFERKIGKIILFPFKSRIIMELRDVLGVPDNIRLRDFLLRNKQ